MMDCFHQRPGGAAVVLRPNCAVLLQVQAAGEIQDIFQNIESMKSWHDRHPQHEVHKQTLKNLGHYFKKNIPASLFLLKALSVSQSIAEHFEIHHGLV